MAKPYVRSGSVSGFQRAPAIYPCTAMFQKKALVEVDSQIAKITQEVADGKGSQIAQCEICELLGERDKIIQEIVKSPPVAQTQSER